MSSFTNAEDYVPPITRKRYRLWKEDDTIPIPLKTRQRWEKNCLRIFNENRNISNHDDIDSLDLGNANMLSNIRMDNDESNINNYDNDNYVDDNSSTDEDECSLQKERMNLVLHKRNSTNVDEILLKLLELYVRYKWTKASLRDILAMLQQIFPENNQLPTSVFKLFQYVRDRAPSFNVIKHFYCKNCLCYNGIESNIDKCFSCNTDRNDTSFFFEIDICEQLKYMFENLNLSAKLKPSLLHCDTNIITDITDGSEYIRVNSRDSRKKYDLTLILNTDGISLVKSSKSHCWPLMFVIAELPKHLRQTFMIMIGLWYDEKCKPSMNTFLQPFCLKLQKCFHDGICWIHPETGEKIISKVVAPLFIADAPARAQLQNIVNFNGRYGCNICEIKMKRCEKIRGKKCCRIYLFNEKDSKLRSSYRMHKQAEKVYNSNTNHIKGVKGNTIISTLPLIDLGTCVLPEYMHSVLLGIVRQLLHLWFNIKGPWNIKKYIKEIDNILLSIRPPHFFNRLPRSITLAKFYKASEYYNWMLFYSLPILVNYLPHKYFQHWLLLIVALFILLKDSIEKVDLEIAQKCLKSFVKKTKFLYGDRQLTYNMHQLLHLTLIVTRWGPLWATSAFPFENFNGFLANSVHGKKHMGQEIINNLSIIQSIQILKNRVAENNTNILVNNKRIETVDSKIDIVLSKAETELLQSNSLDPTSLYIYTRAKIDGEIFTSKQYKSTKTNSFTIQISLVDGRNFYGSIIFFFTKINHFSSLYFVLDCFTVDHNKIFYHEGMQIKVEHIIYVKENKKLIIIELAQVKSIQHVIKVDNYICKQPNVIKQIW